MIGCLLACIKFKQSLFKWLVLAGLLFHRVTHLFASHRLKKCTFSNVARLGGGQGKHFFRLLMSLGANPEK